jgi:hypothetical protein
MNTNKKETPKTQLAATDPLQNQRSTISIPRRIFVAGLAAVMSAFSIPNVSATKPTGTSENEFDDYYFEPQIEYLEIGECEDMLGGPAEEAGYYLHPECMMGCCHSKGPFLTKEAALEQDRIRWAEITKAEK